MENKKYKSAYLVDPDLKSFTDMLTSGSTESLQTYDSVIPENLAVEITEKYIDGGTNSPNIRVLFYQPKEGVAPMPAYLSIHGGGMISGKPEDNNSSNAELATSLNCIVVSVDYRLAPQAQYPCQIEDCYSTLKWMHDNAQELGIDTKRIAIGGASAGAGLAASLALMARDKGEIKVILQVLKSPMLDDRTCIKAPHPYNGEYVWTPELNQLGWQSMLGKAPGSADISPYASAPRSNDLSGLPATFISVGAIDLFFDESVDYAKRLVRAGIPTELHVYPGAHHAALAVHQARNTIAANTATFDALKRAFFG